MFLPPAKGGGRENTMSNLVLPVNRISDYLEKAAKTFWEKDPIRIHDNAILTGFERLDEAIGGMKRGGLYLLGGAPGMGTTAFALNLANNVAVKRPGCVLYHTNQTSALALTKRMIRLIGKIAWDTKKEDAEADEAIKEAVRILEESSLFFSDTKVKMVSEFMHKNPMLQLKRKPDLIIIDSLEGINNADSRNEKLVDCKNLAVHFDCPVLVIMKCKEEKVSAGSYELTIGSIGMERITKQVDTVFALNQADKYDPDCDMKGIAELSILRSDSCNPQKIPFVAIDDFGCYISMGRC